jgi:hypothetical protein
LNIYIVSGDDGETKNEVGAFSTYNKARDYKHLMAKKYPDKYFTLQTIELDKEKKKC